MPIVTDKTVVNIWTGGNPPYFFFSTEQRPSLTLVIKSRSSAVYVCRHPCVPSGLRFCRRRPSSLLCNIYSVSAPIRVLLLLQASQCRASSRRAFFFQIFDIYLFRAVFQSSIFSCFFFFQILENIERDIFGSGEFHE